MRASIKGLLGTGAAAVITMATPALAADYSIAGLAVKAMTYTTVGAASAARTNAYNGVGSVFATTVSTGPNSGFLCTGSLINARTVLTAAHCVYDHDETTGALDPITSITFYLPSFGERNAIGVEKYAVNSFAYNPLYDDPTHTGDIGGGHDVALLTLGSAATGHDTYSLYTGDPLQQYLEVGTGTIGGPRGTNQGITSDYERCTGSNIFELYGDELFSDVTHGVVLSDFDDGTAAHDVFGRNQADIGIARNLTQTGIAGEADSSPGDSGGPEFINGQIAAVTSFGITGGIFDGFCGGTSTDPYNASGTTAVRSLGNCTNSSVGEIAGDTLVSYNMGYINAYLAGRAARTPLPEPGTWTEMIVGFGLIGGLARRARRRSVRVAFA